MVPTTVVIGAAAAAPTLFVVVAWLSYWLGARRERRKALDLADRLGSELSRIEPMIQRLDEIAGLYEQLVEDEDERRRRPAAAAPTAYRAGKAAAPRADEEPWTPQSASLHPAHRAALAEGFNQRTEEDEARAWIDTPTQ